VPDADIYIQALCTAPFLDAEVVERALRELLAHPTARSLVAVSRRKQYLWDSAGPAYGNARIPNSVDLPETVVEAMSLYIVRRFPGEPPPTRRHSPDALLFSIEPQEDIDVNFPSDLALAERICAGQRAQQNLQLKLLKMHLSSPILADICKEMDVGKVLAPRIRRVVGNKVLGVAKTLQLRALPEQSKFRKTEEWKGIYDALDSYQFIRPGDVIMVATSIPEKAYFGDLNAHLAMRVGAEGAIIDGYTRDTEDVRALGFAVFAHGSYCDDVKYEGTTESMNTPIQMGGATVRNGDYVFGDGDGVVVIPREAWPAVQREAWASMHREAQIRLSVLEGRAIDQILSRHGTF
jgi:regulator of RNase E activity RraA